MKNEWPLKTLGQVCEFVRGPFGGSLKKSMFVENGFAVYEQQHAIYNQFHDIRYFIDAQKFQEMQRFEVHPRDLIMSCSGTMGKVAIVPADVRHGIINQALLKLTPSIAVSPEFLKYWMGSTDFQDSLKEQSGGAAIQNVASVSILKEIKIPLPPRGEQQRIVSILDEAFKGIATAKANADKNLQNACVMLESQLESIFAKPSGDWRVCPLAECLQLITYGFTNPMPTTTEGPYMVTAKNVVRGEIDYASARHTSKQAFESLTDKSRPKVGDVLLTKDGTLGRLAVVDRENICINQSVALLRPNGRMKPHFMKYLLSTPGIRPGW